MHRVAQRRRQVDLARNTLSYAAMLRASGMRRHDRRSWADASARVARQLGEPDPALKMSKRAWEGSMRTWRARLYAAAPQQCTGGGLRPLDAVLDDPAEAELLARASALGLDLAVRSVWHREGDREASMGCFDGARQELAGSLTLWVPPPLPQATARCGDDEAARMELHRRSVAPEGSDADAFASRVAWAAAEAAWSPMHGPERPPEQQLRNRSRPPPTQQGRDEDRQWEPPAPSRREWSGSAAERHPAARGPPGALRGSGAGWR